MVGRSKSCADFKEFVQSVLGAGRVERPTHRCRASASVPSAAPSIARVGGIRIARGVDGSSTRECMSIMGQYDTQQVCTNGHQVTASYHRSPERREKYCGLCGAETHAYMSRVQAPDSW